MTAVGLLVAAVALLCLGGFVHLDDTSGFGSDAWVMPLGAVAVVLGAAAIGKALRHRDERRPLGTALGILVVAVMLLARTDDGFRFVWHSNEGELYLAAAVAGWGALALYALGGLERPTIGGAPAPVLLRIVIYVFCTGVATMMAFDQGTRDFFEDECQGGGDCDLAALAGMGWAAITLLVSIAVIALYEIVRHDRQRRAAKV
jgi:hypothetical protein